MGRPSPSISTAAAIGPSAKPTGLAAPNTATTRPRRARGTTSRIPATMTPVLPSWRPTSINAPATCHGCCASATRAKTPVSTSALRTITALRLYLSAHTPHSGTRGRPSTKTRELNRPTKATRSAWGTPSSRKWAGSRAKTWLMP